MRDNPYKDLPPLERRPNGSLYRMTPAQRKQAASLIRRECCCFEDGNCIVLDDGDLGPLADDLTHTEAVNFGQHKVQ